MTNTLDLKLIEELQNDCRQSNTALAKKLGISGSTVRRRIDNLVKNKTIRFTAVLNPVEYGTEVLAYYFINTSSHSVEKVAEEMAKISDMVAVLILNSDIDIVAVGYFHTINDAWELLNNRILRIKGITHVKTCPVLKRVKRPL